MMPGFDMLIRLELQELQEILPEARIEGSCATALESIASLADATPRDISFLANPKYRKDVPGCRAGAILVPEQLDLHPREGQAFVRVPDPSLALAALCERVEKKLRPRPPAGIHPSAVIEAGATVAPSASVGAFCYIAAGASVGADTVLEAHCFIGRRAVVGENCHLHPRVVVHDHCRIGNFVILQPGAIIGGDGFGYQQVGSPPDLVHKKIPQIGIVRVEDDVEIGSGTTIDRARFGETVIGQGTKIDNLVQIAHNVRVGRRCIICAQAGISGSTTLGDFVVVWGQAGLSGHIQVGSGAFIGGQAGVSKSVAPGQQVTGTPARDLLDVRRTDAFIRRLPERLKQIEDLLKEKSEGSFTSSHPQG